MFMLSQKDMDIKIKEKETLVAQLEFIKSTRFYIDEDYENNSKKIQNKIIQSVRTTPEKITRRDVKDAIKRKIKVKALYNSIGA